MVKLGHLCRTQAGICEPVRRLVRSSVKMCDCFAPKLFVASHGCQIRNRMGTSMFLERDSLAVDVPVSVMVSFNVAQYKADM